MQKTKNNRSKLEVPKTPKLLNSWRLIWRLVFTKDTKKLDNAINAHIEQFCAEFQPGAKIRVLAIIQGAKADSTHTIAHRAERIENTLKRFAVTGAV